MITDQITLSDNGVSKYTILSKFLNDSISKHVPIKIVGGKPLITIDTKLKSLYSIIKM